MGLLSCKPSDSSPKSVRERLEAGEVVYFAKAGERSPGCFHKQRDWTSLFVRDREERELIVSKRQLSSLNDGYKTCYRVGSIIALDDSKQKDKAGRLGQVLVERIGLVKLTHLSARLLKGSAWNAQKLSEAQGRLGRDPKHHGIVTIVDYTYQSQSAFDEAEILEKTQPQFPDFEETLTDGQALSGEPCSQWNYLVVRPSFQKAITERNLQSWYQLGAKSCFTQGQKLDLKLESAKGQTFVRVQITKLKRIPYKKLDERSFILGQVSFEQVLLDIDLAKRTRPPEDDFLIIVDFSVLEPDTSRAEPL